MNHPAETSQRYRGQPLELLLSTQYHMPDQEKFRKAAKLRRPDPGSDENIELEEKQLENHISENYPGPLANISMSEVLRKWRKLPSPPSKTCDP
ncbi:uncharacterized protein PG998_014820 [Apiospora kogelbergensis]|uniref:uncharacterized protein n=1 Tax=Apiospora kogelbergensis TaxID=1337665 RepID=UPI00312DEC4D